jgi:hypothetical protein
MTMLMNVWDALRSAWQQMYPVVQQKGIQRLQRAIAQFSARSSNSQSSASRAIAKDQQSSGQQPPPPSATEVVNTSLQDDLDDVWGTPVEAVPPAPPSPQSPAGNPLPPPSSSSPEPITSSKAPLPDSAMPFSTQVAAAIADLVQAARPIIATASEKARPLLQQAVSKLETVSEKIRLLLQQASSKLAVLRPYLTPLLERVQPIWRKGIDKIRTVLPPSLHRNLSDSALTGVLAGVLLVVLLTGSTLLSPPASPSQQSPTPPAVVATKQPPPPTRQKRNSSPAIAPSPSPASRVDQAPPALDLPPAQSLIAAIQDQVAEITNQFSEGLVQSVQANFRTSQLTATVSDTWYTLTAERQDSLAAEMFHRAQELDFNSLVIIDSEKHLLSRSPIVGQTMVMLQRSRDQAF